MMAQAAHAASAVQHRFATHPDMVRYLAGDGGDGRGWEVMRKAVLEVSRDTTVTLCAVRY
jgi:hypothetical protein